MDASSLPASDHRFMLPRRLPLASSFGGLSSSEEEQRSPRKWEPRRSGLARSGRRGAAADEEAMLSVGKRRREDDDSTSSGSSSSSDSGTDSDSARDEPAPRPASKKTRGLTWELELGIVLVILLVIGGGAWAYMQHSSSSLSAASTASSNEAAAPTTSEIDTTRTRTTAEAAATPTTTTAAASTTKAGTTATKDSATTTSTPAELDTTSSSSSANDDDATTTTSATGTPAADPPDSAWSGITLAGSWVPTDVYLVATGTAADVAGTSSTVALDGFTTAAATASATQGLIYVGDSTWYAAGEGGYGSCGEMLYDGQDIYFAAMSLYHWMGSPGPSAHCWYCVLMQSVEDPSKAITAIVADSCEACEFAHIDLEQKAFYTLGGTVNGGTITVAWEFIDCPDGYSEDAIAALDSSVYVAVDTS